MSETNRRARRETERQRAGRLTPHRALDALRRHDLVVPQRLHEGRVVGAVCAPGRGWVGEVRDGWGEGWVGGSATHRKVFCLDFFGMLVCFGMIRPFLECLEFLQCLDFFRMSRLFWKCYDFFQNV